MESVLRVMRYTKGKAMNTIQTMDVRKLIEKLEKTLAA